MSNIFLCSDHHLSHENIVVFKRKDGVTPLRNFKNITEHDEHIIAQHNKVVRPNDKVYFLGDVTFHNKYLHLIARMNGEKVLIKGNHDTLKLSQYQPYFKDIRAYHILDKFILSHIPIHPLSFSRWAANIHGHLHDRVVPGEYNKPDNRYYNVSMEQLDNYTPISLEDMKSRLRKLHLIT